MSTVPWHSEPCGGRTLRMPSLLFFSGLRPLALVLEGSEAADQPLCCTTMYYYLAFSRFTLIAEPRFFLLFLPSLFCYRPRYWSSTPSSFVCEDGRAQHRILFITDTYRFFLFTFCNYLNDTIRRVFKVQHYFFCCSLKDIGELWWPCR